MSQRVQKGNTTFRPVARPRPRAGVEPRQPSVIPENVSIAGPSRVQDAPIPPMAPPSSVPHRPLAEPEGSSREPTSPSTQGDVASLNNTSSNTGRSGFTKPVPVARNPPPRMPPMICSSQRPVPPRFDTIQATQQNAIRIPSRAPPHVVSVVAPPILRLPADSSGSNNYPPTVPAHIPATMDDISSLAFPLDPAQIDPQLMRLAAIPFHDSAFDNGHVTARDVAVNVSGRASSRPRKTSRRRSEAGLLNAEQNVEDDTNVIDPDSTTTRQKRSKRTPAGSDENTNGQITKKRTVPGRARTRPPSPPPFDPDADPGEELDPTVVTMAILCDDTGRGRVSSRAAQIVSNHATWRATNREKRARMRAIMEAKKYGRNPEEEEERIRQGATGSPPTEDPASASLAEILATNPSTQGSGSDANEDVTSKEMNGFDYTEHLAVSRYNVQVRIGANGETIIDEDSLFVSRDEEHHTEDYTHVEESDFTKFVNSATYSKKARGSRWSAEETELFYDALSQFGENYELISYVLPGRDRKACKNKFKSEDKKNPARITFCLNNRKPYDIATLTRMTGKDFSGPTPEIRAPTPVLSTELETISEEPSVKVTRKKSRTPSVRETDVEIVGDIDEVEKDDFIDHTFGSSGTALQIL